MVTAAGTTAGTAIGLGKNIDILNTIKESKHSNPDVSRVPSPDNDNFFISRKLTILMNLMTL